MSYTTQQFSAENPPLHHLVHEIDTGKLGLPDLQRPFVWKRSRIRDLLDSLYKGFPAGYFLFWETPKEIDSHSIGSETDQVSQQKMIVDGQQRLTSLYSVLKGKPIIGEDGNEQSIEISFNPITQEFSVKNSSSENNPRYISNVSDIWTSGKGSYDFINEYLEDLANIQDISKEEKRRIASNIQRLDNIRNYQFSVLVLSAELDIDTVAEIFQRINAGGIPLNSADFILTLMSVYWVEGRHQLEDFARSAQKPAVNNTPSPYNVFQAPSPDQLLRVSVGLGLKRGVLQNAYQVLRGRDPEDHKVKDSLRERRFNELKDAQDKVLNLTNWHQYINCVKFAGFRSKSMLTSANNFLYTYLLFLIGKYEFSVERNALRSIIGKWFFMSSLTGRYTGSPETILETDLRRLDQSEKSESGYIRYLDSIISSQLTDDYWKVSLPQQLDSSSAYSPYLFGYYAALNLLEAQPLFSKFKISELLDPSVSGSKSPIERHHLFPKAYLMKNGYSGTYKINQIANFAFLEWEDNVDISDKSPSEYFPQLYEKLSDNEKANAAFWHGLPPNWYEMEYWDFVEARRKLISHVINKGYEVLSSGRESEEFIKHGPSISELLHVMETLRVEFKSTARVPLKSDIPEKVINEGIIKTVSAFMNTEGGTLGIGISDDGDILGLQPDLEFKNQDLDGYHNWLSTLLMNTIGEANVAKFVKIRFETADDKVVCLVDVEKANKAVFADTVKGKEIFFVRVGNTTRILTGSEMLNYIESHF